jgi:hypothetical protein
MQFLAKAAINYKTVWSSSFKRSNGDASALAQLTPLSEPEANPSKARKPYVSRRSPEFA